MADLARREGDAEERRLPGSRPPLGQAAGQLRRQRRRGFAGQEPGLRRLALLAQGLQHAGRFCYRRGRRGSQGVCGERKGEKRRGSHFRRPLPAFSPEALEIRASFFPPLPHKEKTYFH